MKVFNILLNLAKKNPYPVGSIYMSINNTNPSTLFGGTWEQIKDTFLLSAGDTYTAGSTGGEAEHTLTADEMPYHTHVRGSYQTSLEANDYGLTSASGFRNRVQVNGNNSGQTTGGTGGGHSHNNLPPYLTVYMWKRTA